MRSTSDINLHRAKLAKAKIPVYLSERDFSTTEYKRPNNYIVYEMKRKFPSIIVINLNDVMCKNGKCKIELNNTIVYRNSNHLNTSGAILLGKAYLITHNNPLKELNFKQHN